MCAWPDRPVWRLRREAVVMGLSYLEFVRLIRISDYAFSEEFLITDISG
jgi:hypothetical protein